MTLSLRDLTLVQWLMAGVLGVALSFMWARQITGAPIIKDASQSLQMAINLSHYGTMALESEPPLVATNYREPLPPIVSSIIVDALDARLGVAAPQAYFHGERARYLKYQNVLWLALFAASVFLVTLRFTSSFFFAMIGVVLVNVPFRPHFAPGPIDDLLNEIPALGLLVGASGLLALAYVRRRPSLFAIAGVLFGALALIKAIFFFVFFALALALAGLFLLQRPTGTVRAAARDLGLLTLAFLCVVGPWLYRNQVELGTLQIAQRSGEAMMERSLEDQMTAQEYAGAVYLWAPHFRRQLGTWLGLSSRDLLAGGKLERLDDDPGSDVSKADLVFERSGNPERTVTFYRRARAERVRLENELEREASPQPEIEADKLLKTEGVAVFERYPLRHLEASALFWWRGTVDTSVVLLIALIFGMRQRRYDLVLFVLPSLGAAAAYVLATPFFPRYDIPMHFVAIVVVVILAKNFWDIARRRYTTM